MSLDPKNRIIFLREILRCFPAVAGVSATHDESKDLMLLSVFRTINVCLLIERLGKENLFEYVSGATFDPRNQFDFGGIYANETSPSYNVAELAGAALYLYNLHFNNIDERGMDYHRKGLELSIQSRFPYSSDEDPQYDSVELLSRPLFSHIPDGFSKLWRSAEQWMRYRGCFQEVVGWYQSIIVGDIEWEKMKKLSFLPDQFWTNGKTFSAGANSVMAVRPAKSDIEKFINIHVGWAANLQADVLSQVDSKEFRSTIDLLDKVDELIATARTRSNALPDDLIALEDLVSEFRKTISSTNQSSRHDLARNLASTKAAIEELNRTLQTQKASAYFVDWVAKPLVTGMSTAVGAGLGAGILFHLNQLLGTYGWSEIQELHDRLRDAGSIEKGPYSIEL